jgi:ferredoxin
MAEYKRAKGKITKIIVDCDLCVGCGACAAMAPEVFALGKKGKSEVKNPNTSDDESVKIAAESCPVSAISIFEGENKIWPK